MVYLGIGIGLVLLVAAAEILIRGAVAVAQRLGVSPMMIGLTLVGFGTSSPELVASVTAALKGSPGIAVGNVVGSNICNILLILGIAAVIRPLQTHRDAFRRDAAMSIAAAAAMLAVALFGSVERIVGGAFVAALVLYIIYVYRTEKRSPDAEGTKFEEEGEQLAPLSRSLALNVLLCIAGLAGLMGGASLLVDGSIALARTFGISESVIGLTVVAIGTSLPELATTLVAAYRGQADVAVGNVIGSNIYNVFGILGVTALVLPIQVPHDIANTDIWLMVGAILAAVVFARSGWRIERWEGGLFLACYVGYLGYLAQGV